MRHEDVDDVGEVDDGTGGIPVAPKAPKPKLAVVKKTYDLDSETEDGPGKKAAKKVKAAAKPPKKEAKEKTAPEGRKATKVKPKAKAAVAKAKPRVNRSEAPSRKPGPAARLFKLKKEADGKCNVLGCSKPRKGRKWCATHTKEVRKEQLRLNNLTWRKKAREGAAGHHVVYTSTVDGKQKPTAWALQNPAKALKQVKESGIVEVEELKKLLARYGEKKKAA
jgi:hypothetical protein